MNIVTLRKIILLSPVFSLFTYMFSLTGCIPTSPWLQLQNDIALDRTNDRAYLLSSTPIITNLPGYSRINVFDFTTEQTSNLVVIPRRYLQQLVVAADKNTLFAVEQLGQKFYLVNINFTTQVSSRLAENNQQTISFNASPVLSYDGTTGFLYILQQPSSLPNLVQRLDPNTGVRITISSSTQGLGPELPYSDHAIIDQANNRLLLAYETGVMAVDLTNGNRSIFSDAVLSVGAGPAIAAASGITIDPTNGQLYILDQAGSLFSIDSLTGDRTNVYSDLNNLLELNQANDLILRGNTLYFMVRDHLTTRLSLTYPAGYLFKLDLLTTMGEPLQSTFRDRQKVLFPPTMLLPLTIGVLTSFIPI